MTIDSLLVGRRGAVQADELHRFDRLQDAVFLHHEVGRLQVLERLAITIHHRDVDAHEIDLAAEDGLFGRRRGLRLLRWGLLRRRRLGRRRAWLLRQDRGGHERAHGQKEQETRDERAHGCQLAVMAAGGCSIMKRFRGSEVPEFRGSANLGNLGNPATPQPRNLGEPRNSGTPELRNLAQPSARP